MQHAITLVPMNYFGQPSSLFHGDTPTCRLTNLRDLLEKALDSRSMLALLLKVLLRKTF